MLVEFFQIQIPTDRTSGTRTRTTQMLTNKFVEICATAHPEESVESMIQQYHDDVDLHFTGELRHLISYVKQKHSEIKGMSHTYLYQIIFQDNVQMAFPNVETVLRYFLSLMVTNYSGERSFSQRIKMSQEKLTFLSILCIETDKLRKIQFEKTLHDFAQSKNVLILLLNVTVLKFHVILFAIAY